MSNVQLGRKEQNNKGFFLCVDTTSLFFFDNEFLSSSILNTYVLPFSLLNQNMYNRIISFKFNVLF